MSNQPSLRLLIAGGGTGGHLFPALAVAQAWEERGGTVLFVGTEQGLENRILPTMGKDLVLLKIGRLKGVGVSDKIRTLLKIPQAIFASMGIIRTFAPHAILGVGGYACGPTVLAGWMLGLPTALHEQNAKPGLTNRLLSRVVQRVFVSFPGTETAFAGCSVHLTGNPVRPIFFQQPRHRDPSFKNQDPFSILVFGGSLGATIFSTLVPQALAKLEGLQQSLRIVHQTRATDVEELQKSYQALGIEATVVSFIHEMDAAYRAADLVICRAGATTVAELAATGTPALLIPYPHAADDHQTANAQALTICGGGWMQPQAACTPEWLGHFLKERILNQNDLKQVSEKAKILAKPEAAQQITEQIRQLILAKK
ncbi:MAG: undecaprenyldiphospho-muramoylpentapeptide beta-N-acetylglucosaminyltransferase [Magnetococcus sp. DMHC-6]